LMYIEKPARPLLTGHTRLALPRRKAPLIRAVR
jgi:hypothetical protein